MCGHVVTEPQGAHPNLSALRENVQLWLKDHNVKSFYSVNQNVSFEDGARNCITMAGLGKLTPNMLLVGFKTDWRRDLASTAQYINIMYCAFDQNMSVAILR